MTELVLSLFPGIGLLDKGFEQAGFSCVRGPDLWWGGDIFKFHIPPGKFSGIIGGPPCQDFSLANRNRDIAGGLVLVNEFLRVVAEGQPDWALMENVAGSPVVTVPGPVTYHTQLFTLDASHVGSEQHRLRKFHFFFRDLPELVIGRDAPGCDGPAARTCLASEGRRKGRRTWEDFCRLQGLPDGFDLPGFTKLAKYEAVGNGVPLPMALALATAIRDRARGITPHRVCECGCGQYVHGKERLAGVACRKRMQRRRDLAAVASPPATSQTVLLDL